MIYLKDSFVRTSPLMSIHYSLNSDNNFSKVCKIATIKAKYVNEVIVKGRLKILASNPDTMNECELYFRIQLNKPSYNHIIKMNERVELFNLYYKWNEDYSEFNIYVGVKQEYTIIDITLMQGQTDVILFTDKPSYEIVEGLTLISDNKYYKYDGACELMNGYTVSGGVNNLEKYEGVTNLRLNITNSNGFANGDVIAKIPANYRPVIYQEIPVICNGDGGQFIGVCKLIIAFSGDLTINGLPNNTREIVISHTYINYIK